MYQITLYLGLFICAFLPAATTALGQCVTTLGVTASSTSICSGGTVSITVHTSASDHYYQLQNDATNEQLSGLFLGNGGDLTIVSSPLSATVTIKIQTAKISPFCVGFLGTKPVITVSQPPTTANAGIDQTKCSGPSSFTMAANAGAPGTAAVNGARAR